jgi:hypothetical protein
MASLSSLRPRDTGPQSSGLPWTREDAPPHVAPLLFRALARPEHERSGHDVADARAVLGELLTQHRQ